MRGREPHNENKPVNTTSKYVKPYLKNILGAEV